MRQELFHHANRPAQIDLNLSSDVFEASSFVVNIDLTHDASVVDQNVEIRKLFGEFFGEFVTDAAGAAGDQNRIACEFHKFELTRPPPDGKPKWWVMSRCAIVLSRKVSSSSCRSSFRN